MNEPQARNIEGKVPHTVIPLPSGRTLAFGSNPDEANGQHVTTRVNAMLDVVLNVERSAQTTGGTITAQSRTEALDRISAARSSLNAAIGSSDALTWGRLVLDRMYRLVSALPTR